jgi:hypothetical protein
VDRSQLEPTAFQHRLGLGDIFHAEDNLRRCPAMIGCFGGLVQRKIAPAGPQLDPPLFQLADHFQFKNALIEFSDFLDVFHVKDDTLDRGKHGFNPHIYARSGSFVQPQTPEG